MSVVLYGIGKNTVKVGGYVAYGLGIVNLNPVIAASISFITNLDITPINNLLVDKDISFGLDLLVSIEKYLELYPEVQFDLEVLTQLSTQLNYNTDVIFNINLSSDFVKQMITEAGISLDAEFDEEVASFIIKFILEKHNIYVIPEELRFLKVFMEMRTCEVSEELRTESIKFEDRVVKIPPKEEN